MIVVWAREPFLHRAGRFIAFAAVFVIVIAVAGGMIWRLVQPFLPLLAVIAMFIGFSWFAFRKRQ